MKRLLAALLVLLHVTLSVAVLRGDPSAAAPASRGGRVAWARLITPSTQWGIHSDQDPKLALFIRQQTTLNIDPIWYNVPPGDLDRLCSYPFIYAKDLTGGLTRSELSNLAEYIMRGGFLCIDPCMAVSRWSPARFLEEHRRVFASMIPGSELRPIPDSDPLFRCYFTVTAADLFTQQMWEKGRVKRSTIDLVGVYQGNRLIAVINTSGLECGWPQTPDRMPGCMKMIVNLYVYAMTR